MRLATVIAIMERRPAGAARLGARHAGEPGERFRARICRGQRYRAPAGSRCARSRSGCGRARRRRASRSPPTRRIAEAMAEMVARRVGWLPGDGGRTAPPQESSPLPISCGNGRRGLGNCIVIARSPQGDAAISRRVASCGTRLLRSARNDNEARPAKRHGGEANVSGSGGRRCCGWGCCFGGAACRYARIARPLFAAAFRRRAPGDIRPRELSSNCFSRTWRWLRRLALRRRSPASLPRFL